MPHPRALAICMVAALLPGAAALAHDPAAQQAETPNPMQGAVTRFEATIAPEGAELPVVTIPRGTRALLAVYGAGTAELHLHGYDLEAAGTADGPAEFVFEATNGGRFPVEMHLEGDLLGRTERPVLFIEVRDE